MRTRITIWILFIATISMLMYQNRDFYLSEQTLSLSLFSATFEIPPIANAIHAALYFLGGILLACVSLYQERFKLRRRLRKLDTAFQSCAERVTELKSSECPQPSRPFSKLMHKLRRKSADPDILDPTTANFNALPE